jgi:hypothetical protein
VALTSIDGYPTPLAGEKGSPGSQTTEQQRDRDHLIRHTISTESEDFAKDAGLRIPEGTALTP